jgi:hypothetical protein
MGSSISVDLACIGVHAYSSIMSRLLQQRIAYMHSPKQHLFPSRSEGYEGLRQSHPVEPLLSDSPGPPYHPRGVPDAERLSAQAPPLRACLNCTFIRTTSRV